MVTVFIRYTLDPAKLEDFRLYAQRWLAIIPSCGGDLLGYFMPYEGTNYEAFGLVRFESLAAYEQYRARLKASDAGKENFQIAQEKGFILREDRTFLSEVQALNT